MHKQIYGDEMYLFSGSHSSEEELEEINIGNVNILLFHLFLILIGSGGGVAY